LRDRAANANSSEFLESLYAVWNRQKASGAVHLRLREVYDMWSLTPGWKRENPLAKFAQDVYALHRSELRATRGGVPFELVTPSANVKASEVLTVIAEDGRTLRFTGIRFSKPTSGRPESE
jgi:hypothetical protein